MRAGHRLVGGVGGETATREVSIQCGSVVDLQPNVTKIQDVENMKDIYMTQNHAV